MPWFVPKENYKSIHDTFNRLYYIKLPAEAFSKKTKDNTEDLRKVSQQEGFMNTAYDELLTFMRQGLISQAEAVITKQEE